MRVIDEWRQAWRWFSCQAMVLVAAIQGGWAAIPDDLRWKIELFKRRGEVLVRQFDHFQEASWLSIYQGHGLRAAAYDPLIERIPLQTLRDVMRQRREFIRQTIVKAPRHEDFIRQHCASEAFSVA